MLERLERLERLEDREETLPPCQAPVIATLTRLRLRLAGQTDRSVLVIIVMTELTLSLPRKELMMTTMMAALMARMKN